MPERPTNDESQTSELYPNQPLVEVVCEIRFPWDLAIECRRHEFHKLIKEQYSGIFVPRPDPGQALETTPYRFEDPERHAGVMVAVDKFAYYETGYAGHQKFIAEFIRLAQVFADVFGLHKLNRVGWRYINIIPFTRESGVLPLRRLLNLGVKVPKSVSEDFENLSIVLISRVSDGSITTKLQSLIRPEDKQEAFLLDFDFGMTEALVFSKLLSYVKTAHDHTQALFEELITDEYRQYLRGDVV